MKSFGTTAAMSHRNLFSTRISQFRSSSIVTELSVYITSFSAVRGTVSFSFDERNIQAV